MKLKNFIEQISKFDPELEVVVYGGSGCLNKTAEVEVMGVRNDIINEDRYPTCPHSGKEAHISVDGFCECRDGCPKLEDENMARLMEHGPNRLWLKMGDY